MRKLEWNVSLAEAAERLVGRCAFEHDTLNHTVGQALHLGQSNETLAVWLERELATHPMDDDGSTSLNLASLVLWAETATVGCASQWCPNVVVRRAKGATGVLTACNYFPPGNYPNQKVLQVGPPCTLCPTEAPYCDNTLCTREKFTFASHLQPFDPPLQCSHSGIPPLSNGQI